MGLAALMALLQVLPLSEMAEARTSRRPHRHLNLSQDDVTEGFFGPKDIPEPDLPWDDDSRPDYHGRSERRAAERRARATRCRECESRSRAKWPVAESRYQARAIRDSLAPSDFMSRLAEAAVHRGHAERGYCYRGVKRIIAAVDPSLARYFNGSRRAIYAMRDLPRAGFRNDMNSCWRPGVIRVYRGPADGLNPGAAHRYMLRRFGIRGTAGDYAGHIEVLGRDHRWHHFTSSATPINHPMHFGPQRRKLVGCFVK
jgi:hypothetical protein